MTRIMPLLILFCLSVVFSCNRQEPLKPMPESANAYLTAYTDGSIARQGVINIQFAGLVIDEDQIGSAVADDLVNIRPNVDGTWKWVDRQSVRFTPQYAFDFSQQYIVSVALGDLFDNVPAEAEIFEFALQTRDPYVSLKIDGLSTPDVNQRGEQVLQGQLTTSDFIANDLLQDMLKVQQAGSNLPVTWSSNDAGMLHQFSISNVQRGKVASTVELSWNGGPVGAEQQGQNIVDVPPLGDFKVSKVEAFGGVDPHLEIYFSDPLNEQQQLAGLISIRDYNGSLRYQAEGHLLKVFLSKGITGDQKVTVFTGIKNLYRDPMPRTSIWDVNFTEIKPEVRLSGRGNILPTSGGLVFPFEAIGLQAVEVEVFKIYSNNILQFLQTNTFDGRDEMHRVGKVVLRKEISLMSLNEAADQRDWTRYALDLNTLFAADAKAIYQVRIGFRPEHSSQSCLQLDNFTFSENNRQEDQDLLNSWYGINGYYREYRWNHKDDPCFPAYYNADRFIVKNVLVSNLGIIAKAGEDKQYHLAVTDLRTTKPTVGAELSFYDFQQQLLTTAITDGNGFASVKLDDPAFVVTANTATDQGYLRLQDGEALSLSRFDVAGVETQDGLKGYLYGERGVWRPGDSVFVNFILEDENGLLPPDYPISYELRDAQGQLAQQGNGITPVGLIYPLHFRTETADATGLWQLKVMVGNVSFKKNIRIEEVKPNRIKMELDFSENPVRLASGNPSVSLNSAWLHGAPANELKANVEATLVLDKSGFEQFADYRFYGKPRSVLAKNLVVFDGTTNASGTADFNINLPHQELATGPLKMNLRSRVYEQSGNFSTDNQQVEVHPYDYYAGVLSPKNRYGSPRIIIGQETSVGLAAVDYKGQASVGRQLSAKLYRVEWRWWWDDNDNSRQASYNRERSKRQISETTQTTNAQGRAEWEVKVEEWGRYLIEVCDSQSGHCAETYVYAGSPWYNEQSFSEEATMLTFQADQATYEVGEEVTLTFPAGGNGRALLSIENGSGVLEERWINTEAGDNTYSFKATAEMTPNIYASLTVLQAHEQDENDMPLRAYGVIPILVSDPATHLTPVLKLADELAPDKTFVVEVKEDQGRAMSYTLAVVDEGLLSLTRFKTPNPHDAFFAREALGVKSWDLYNYVLGRHNTQLDKILSIGGDGELGSGEAANRANRFEPVVMHLGPFTLEKGAKVKHTIKMPNYVGAVRVMLVGAANTAYGAADKSVPVRQPLMLLATLPRVLGIGETLNLPVNIFAMKEGLGTVNVKVEESSGLVQLAGAQRETQFSQMGDEIVSFPLIVGNAVGIAKFKIRAEGGGERASQEIEIDVRNPNPEQTLIERYVLAPGEEKSPIYEPFGSAGTRKGTLEMTNLPPLDLDRRVKYLIRYPYGCLEQTISSGFPQLHLATFLELTDAEAQATRDNVAATLTRLGRFQLSSGGFAYWPGNTGVASWATNYAGHFMLAAQAEGYTVPGGLLENWLSFQQQSARRWDGQLIELGQVRRGSYELDQAYRLFTLALAGRPELGAMNRLREQAKLSTSSRWRLAAAYALAGQESIANDLVNKLSTDVGDYRELSYTYGSAFRDKAMILETLLLLDKGTEADRAVQLLSNDMSSRTWLSTHDIAYGLLAMSKYIGADEALAKTYTFTVQQAGASAVDAGADHPYMQINLADRSGEVRIKNTSQQKLFASIVREGQPLPEAEEAVSNLLNISVSYLNGKGQGISVNELQQGTDFVAEVKVKHPGSLSYTYEELALEQIFPAGWEITNTRFEGIQGEEESSYEYRDFRDDRVHTFFDLQQGATATFRVQLSATYAGRFYLPASSCGAMYDNKIYAATPGYWVEVKE